MTYVAQALQSEDRVHVRQIPDTNTCM